MKFSKYQEEKYKTETLDRGKIREKVLHDINLPQYDRQEEVPTHSFGNQDRSRILQVKGSGSAAKQLRQNMTPYELRLEQEATKGPFDGKSKMPRLREFMEQNQLPHVENKDKPQTQLLSTGKDEFYFKGGSYKTQMNEATSKVDSQLKATN